MNIQTIGGYNEVGRNMTAVTVGDETVLLDCGIHLENYIKLTEDEDIIKFSTKQLIEADAVPDISQIKDKKKVVAILPSHAHLDHIGAIPALAKKFPNAGVYGTPFTISVLQKSIEDEKIELFNHINSVHVNGSIKLTKNITAEFINVTHSTPHAAMIALHTKEGIIIYANDFKFDKHPTLGEKVNVKRLKQLARKGVKVLLVDSTYSRTKGRMESESYAKKLLHDVLFDNDNKKKGIMVTTFSSHIARLQAIIEFGKKMGRKVVFLGRSLTKYSFAAEDIGLVTFSKDVELVRYWKQIKKKIKSVIADGKEKYLLVVTGHQGEPKSTLAKMVDKKTDYHFSETDMIVFSCKTIPTPTNRANRDYLERNLREYGVEIYTDIHVSGHGASEEIKELIELVKPKHLIPSHGEPVMREECAELAKDLGYKKDTSVHLMENGDEIKI